MKKIFKYLYFLLLVLFYPSLSLATNLTPAGDTCELGTTGVTFSLLVKFFICNINTAIIPLIFVLAFLMFVWGVVKFTLNSSEEIKKEEGRQFMLWGVVGLTVMVCVWGLVGILANTFHVNVRVIPQVQTPATTTPPTTP
ncbi:MAG: hypothetical protein WCI76_00155 [bacterium]